MKLISVSKEEKLILKDDHQKFDELDEKCSLTMMNRPQNQDCRPRVINLLPEKGRQASKLELDQLSLQFKKAEEKERKDI